ncbi:hypothetical protein ACIA03_19935 [Nocardioides sp. NPDC051685]|uniref:hypothetical protein n=1 Tax=Nocardioides sp. NPDC051685 TaxID=3364334 RepID=UPI0037A996E0
MGDLVHDDLTFVSQKVLGDVDTEEVHTANDSDPTVRKSTNKPYAGTTSPEESVSGRERSIFGVETADFDGERSIRNARRAHSPPTT